MPAKDVLIVAILVAWPGLAVTVFILSIRAWKSDTRYLRSVAASVSAEDAAALRKGVAPTFVVIDQLPEDAFGLNPVDRKMWRVPSLDKLATVRKTAVLKLYHQEVRTARGLTKAMSTAALALYGVIGGFGVRPWLDFLGELRDRADGARESLAVLAWQCAAGLVMVVPPLLAVALPFAGYAWVHRRTSRAEVVLEFLEQLIERRERLDAYHG